jgi:hypothetical protein
MGKIGFDVIDPLLLARYEPFRDENALSRLRDALSRDFAVRRPAGVKTNRVVERQEAQVRRLRRRMVRSFNEGIKAGSWRWRPSPASAVPRSSAESSDMIATDFGLRWSSAVYAA